MKKLICIIILLTIGCGSYTPKPKIKHVLAVTTEGDTLLIPIDKIRPTISQNIYPYYGNRYASYYYNGWRYNTNVYSGGKIYKPNNDSNNSNNNTGSKSNYESKDISRLDVNSEKIKMKQ